MKFRLTVFLFVANLFVLFFIWSLERSKDSSYHEQMQLPPFTVLEISGSNVDKPRVLKFEDNRWRIVSPIDWKANLYAVNRIKTQIEFLDRKTSFSKKEALSAGHTLTEYGLDTPVYTLRYGDGETMNAIVIGKNTSVGNRFYLLDEANDSIVVVDKAFVEGLIQDMERLRDQSVFTLPHFEVNAFSVRLPISKQTNNKNEFKFIGLKKDSGAWKFETPIVATADIAEVEAFISDICKIPILNFNLPEGEKTGFELSALPTTITLQGTNRREVLMLGAVSKDGKYVYARLESNPTIFAVDASILKKFEDMQTLLRDKNIFVSNPSRITGIDISENGKTLKLRKLTSGSWEVVGTGSDGKVMTLPADVGLVNKLLLCLENVKARRFVSDTAGNELEKYGITKKSAKVSLIDDRGTVQEISLGSFYRSAGDNLRYATVGGTNSVYGIGREISNLAIPEILFYRSRIVCSLASDDVIKSIKILNLQTSKTDFELVLENPDFSKNIVKMPMRKVAAIKAIESFIRDTVAESFTPMQFNNTGITTSNGKIEKWNYALEVVYQKAKSAEQQKRVWNFSKRLGATIQYCNVVGDSAVFFPQISLINSLFELTQDSVEPAQLKMPVPLAPSKQ